MFRHRLVIQIAFVLAVPLVVLLGWAGREYNQARIAGESELRRFGQAVRGSVVGALQVDVRCGCISSARLLELLENIRDSTGLDFIAIAVNGRGLLSSGSMPEGFAAQDLDSWFIGSSFVVRHVVKIQDVRRGCGPESGGNGRRLGEGRRQQIAQAECDLSLGDSPQKIFLGLPLTSYRESMAATKRWLIVVVFVGSLAILGVGFAWVLRVRAKTLVVSMSRVTARAEHLAELGQAAAGLAHETRNPLGLMRGLAQQIADNPAETSQVATKAQLIVDAADTAAARTGDFLAYARPRSPEMAPLQVRNCSKRIADLMDPEFVQAGVRLSCEAPEDCVISADATMFTQVLLNLLLNSLHASPRESLVTLACRVLHREAVIEVIDRGSGIPAEILSNIFKPYVSGRSGGHGLGLAVVRRIADAHGWTVTAHPGAGGGTTMRIAGISLSSSQVAAAG